MLAASPSERVVAGPPWMASWTRATRASVRAPVPCGAIRVRMWSMGGAWQGLGGGASGVGAGLVVVPGWVVPGWVVPSWAGR